MHLVSAFAEPSQPAPKTQHMLRLAAVEERTGLKKSTVYALIRAGSFPQPVMIGSRSVAWHADEIDAWCASRPRREAVAAP